MKRIDDNDTLSFELYDRTLQQIKGRLNTKKKCSNKILQSVQVTPQVETTETPTDTAQTCPHKSTPIFRFVIEVCKEAKSFFCRSCSRSDSGGKTFCTFKCRCAIATTCHSF